MSFGRRKKKQKRQNLISKWAWCDPDGDEIMREPVYHQSEEGRRQREKFKEKWIEKGWIRFQSIAEAKRFVNLRKLEIEGIISDLELQVGYSLDVDGDHLGMYYLDFQYIKDGRLIVEDVKGQATDLYRWKARHFKAQYKDKLFIEVPSNKTSWSVEKLLNGGIG